jgi:4-deoxy-L-threo-5-hexosulose-uronate ketol-isomerase
MLTVETRYAIDPDTAKGLDTQGSATHFMPPACFRTAGSRLVYTHYDRLILGGAVPGRGELVLDQVKEAARRRCSTGANSAFSTSARPAQ